MNPDIFSQMFPELADKFEKLDALARLVEEKSKVVNITAIRDYEGIWQKHIIDSLMVVRMDSFVNLLKLPDAKVCDMGTGAGFPGLPLAIAYPQVHFTLVDSTLKKIEVVNEFVEELGLDNVKTEWGRAEQLAKSSIHLNAYSVITARALTFLPELLKLCEPFVKSGGGIFCYKLNNEKEISPGVVVGDSIGLRLAEKFEYGLELTKDRIILNFTK